MSATHEEHLRAFLREDFDVTLEEAQLIVADPATAQILQDYYAVEHALSPDDAAVAVADTQEFSLGINMLDDSAASDASRDTFAGLMSMLYGDVMAARTTPAPKTSPAPIGTNATNAAAPIDTTPATPIGTTPATPIGTTPDPTLSSNTSTIIPTSEQDLERYVQLSMKYGPQRAKDIIKTYGYSPQTTDTTVNRGRHDYTPMTIARYTDFLPERDLFQRGLNRWGYPIGPRLLGKQYIDGFR